MRLCPICSLSFDDGIEFCPHDGAYLLGEDPLVGQVVDGKYRVEGRLGAGGMGAVYRATQLALKRTVALKVIVAQAIGRSVSAQRFEREAVMIARLKHPNIVAVHDYGVAPGVGAYLVLEFLEGDSLRDELRARGRLPVAEAVAWTRQICSAVQTAHAAGVVHRDLKPDNVFLERLPEGRLAKVLDFGIARFLEEAAHPATLTHSGAILGTPLYMSPEQCRGEAAGVASDVYSIGCVLYEMLTGNPPFVAQEPAAVLYRHVSVPPVAPSRYAPEIPGAVEAAVLRALAKRPEERFASAADFGRALAGETVQTLAFAAGLEPAPGRAETPTTAAMLPTSAGPATPNNLPQYASRFIGRGRDSIDVRRRLAAARLVTLTGAGGIGKTRLAVRIASESLGEFPDGVWLVELASTTDPLAVVQRAAAAVGLREAPSIALLETLSTALRDRELLLVLDNCEHLLEACAELAGALTRACASVRILATSREPLGVDGELVWQLPPLSLPDPEADLAPGRLAEFEAVALFLDRARMSRPSFALTEQTAGPVAELCRRLDGLPLAIELAAARVKSLSVPQILAKLDEGLRVLSGGARNALPRHQTLRAAIDWSYDLLAESERALLRRVSIFAGGWSLEAAEAVCAGEGIDAGAVFDHLSHLVDKSLVAAEELDGETRYAMAEVLRQYCREKLREEGEEGRLVAAHRDWFLDYAERAAALFGGGEHERWRLRMEAEQRNLHAVLVRGRASGEAPELSLRLSVALGAYWDMYGHWSEGRAWLELWLAAAPAAEPLVRARALLRAGSLAHHQGDLVGARAMLEESLSLLRGTGHSRMIADVLSQLGRIANSLDDARLAVSLLAEALELHREAGQPIAIAGTLHHLGAVSRDAGQLDEAERWLEESLATFREAGFAQGIGVVLSEMANLALRRGSLERAAELAEESLAVAADGGFDFITAHSMGVRADVYVESGRPDRALELYADALEIARRLGATEETTLLFEGLARALAAAGRAERALTLAGAAARLRETTREPIPPLERRALERRVEQAREAAGEGAARAVEAGRAMPVERAIAFALESARAGATAPAAGTP